MSILRKAAAAFCVAILPVMFPPEVSAQVIAVKTNALMLCGLTPNIGCEIVTGEHTSVDLSAAGHKRPFGLDSELLLFKPEFRYWFNGRPMVREYAGVAVLGSMYDLTARGRVYRGEAAGMGITGGYVLALGRRWNLEFSGSFGMVFYRQQQYYAKDRYEDYSSPIGANDIGFFLSPLDLGVKITYIIK